MGKDKTIAARMERYQEAQQKRGMTQIKIWVPSDKAEKIKQIAAQLRAEARDG